MIRVEQMADLPEEVGSTPGPEGGPPLFRLQRISHDWLVNLEEVLSFDVEATLAQIDEAAKEFASQMTAGMIEHISQVTEALGQTVSAGDRDVYEAFYEAVEKIDFDFDEDGNHNMVIMVNPKTAEYLRDHPPTPEQEARMDALFTKKREAWHAARRRSALPGLAD